MVPAACSDLSSLKPPGLLAWKASRLLNMHRQWQQHISISIVPGEAFLIGMRKFICVHIDINTHISMYVYLYIKLHKLHHRRPQTVRSRQRETKGDKKPRYSREGRQSKPKQVNQLRNPAMATQPCLKGIKNPYSFVF